MPGVGRLIRMIAAAALLYAVPPPAAPAQSIGGIAPQKAADAPTPAEATKAVDDLLRALDDPAVREALRRRLAADAAAAPARAAMDEDDPVDEALSFVGDSAARVSNVLLRGARALGRLPELFAWLADQVRDPRARRLAAEVVRDLALAVGVAAVPAVACRLALRRLRRRLAPRQGLTAPGNAALVVARFAAELVPVAVFAAALAVVARTTQLTPLAQLIAREIILAVLVARGVAALRRALLYPLAGQGRLMPLDDHQAQRVNTNLILLGAVTIYGYFALKIGLVFQLSADLHEVLLHLLFFGVATATIILVLRSRQAVHDWLLSLVGDGERRGWARALPLRGIARHWHVVAIGWIAVHFLAWSLHLPGGLRWLLLNNLATVVVLVMARLAALALKHPTQASPGAAAGEAGEGPAEVVADEPSAGRSALRGALRTTVDVLTFGALVLIWAPGLRPWLTGADGAAFLGELLQLAIVAGAIFLIWLMVSRRVHGYLSAVDAEGRPQHSGRARTLAVIARNAVCVALLAFTVVYVLSTMGVNTGPLLAGAGVVGIAVGFGAQTLVKDIITGLFILLGDAIRVGDVVDLGGRSGVVEAISMRTVTLRGYNGDVHTIPYSTIDVVTNMTKHFSYAVFEIGVAYREDVDRVADLLRDIDRQLRRRWPFRRLMLEPIEIAGLDRFGDSAVVIKARIKTGPGDQWRVMREFNRRIKQRFDELGIEIPFPQRSFVLSADRDGHAQTLAIEVRRRQLLAEPDAAPAKPEPLGRTG